MKVKKPALVAAALAALMALASCGAQTQAPRVDDRPGEKPETVIVYRDIGGGNEDARGRNAPTDDDMVDDADDQMQSGGQLPADFPLPVPDDYRVEAVGNVGNETAAVLEAPSGEDAYNYYRQALADAGFRVMDEGRNQTGFFDAEIEFSNDTLEGNVDFEGNTIEVGYEKYE